MKKRIVIIGSSDLGKQLAHHVGIQHEADVVGFFDDFAPLDQVIGRTNDVVRCYESGLFDAALIGVGYKAMSFRVQMVRELSGIVPLFIHRSKAAYVDETATLGEGTVLLPGVIIDQDVKIGKNCFLTLGCSVSHQSVIGENTYCSPHVTICGKCKIGARCFLGAGCVIRDGITITDGVTVGAGAVVVKDIVDTGVYVGCPAKLLKK